jgi:hypothetical protein
MRRPDERPEAPLQVPVADFVALSRVLTGVEELDTRMGELYLRRLLEDVEASALLPRFIERCREALTPRLSREEQEERLRREVLDEEELGLLARRIIVLWYTGQLPTADKELKKLMKPTQPEEYFGALIWPVIGAHPPGLSGGYFGYWRYPPEN